jgi:hypothetical protein
VDKSLRLKFDISLAAEKKHQTRSTTIDCAIKSSIEACLAALAILPNTRSNSILQEQLRKQYSNRPAAVLSREALAFAKAKLHKDILCLEKDDRRQSGCYWDYLGQL